MRIACVLKQGGPDYAPEHVYQLADSILQHNDVPIECYTDAKLNHPGIKRIPLVNGFAGWWSKMELFRECKGPTLYLDLDTRVIGKLPAIGGEFTMLADVYQPGNFGSGVMSWQVSPAHIYQEFIKRPAFYMQRYRTRRNWGDQAFIRDYLGYVPAVFGDEFRSYKVHCAERIPAGTRAVFFHGQPRPWQVDFASLLSKSHV